jgi:hypothetical protein
MAELMTSTATYTTSYAKTLVIGTQTCALVRSRGPGFALEGINFPVKNGYVTITAMGKEAAGIVLGPLNVGGSMGYVVRFCQTHSHGASGSW